MEIVKILILGILVICELAIFFFALKKGKFLRTVFLNGIFGITALITINLSSKYTGCYIPVNMFSVIFPATFGIPAVGGLLFIKFLFI